VCFLYEKYSLKLVFWKRKDKAVCPVELGEAEYFVKPDKAVCPVKLDEAVSPVKLD